MVAIYEVNQGNQKQHFYDRLKRVEKGGKNTFHQIHVGPVEDVQKQQRGGARRAKKAAVAREYVPRESILSKLGALLFVAPLSLVIGAVALVAARILRVSIYGGGLTGAEALTYFGLDIGGAFVLAVIVRKLLRIERFVLTTLIGIAILAVYMHNLVHAERSFFAMLFTQDWVSQVVNSTRAGTLLIAGKSFSL